MMNKRNRDTLLVKYGLNNPFLVGTKRNKYCVFVYNPKTKRLNTVYFDKFDYAKKSTPIKLQVKSIELQSKPSVVLEVEPKKRLLNKNFWANEFFKDKWTMQKAKNFRTHKIVKGKFKKI